jgi:hypothetical protein
MLRLSRNRLGIAPLTMTTSEVAEIVFRRSDTWFRRWLRKHPDFPRSDELGLYLVKQIERWLDARFADPDQGPDALEVALIAEQTARAMRNED